MIRAVFFDAGGTLVRPRKTVGEIYADVARRHGGVFEGAVLQESFKASFAGTPSLTGPRARSPEAYREWWREVVFKTLEGAGVNPAHAFHSRRQAYFDELYEVFAGPERWEPFPEAVDVLEAVRSRGLATVLVSNWDERLRPLLVSLDLLRLLDQIVISSEVGVEKPDPEIFRIALERVRLEPQEALHVGDSRSHDLVPAQTMGLQALLLDRPTVDLTAVLDRLQEG